MTPPIEETTVQKYDMQFGTNVVGTRIVARLIMAEALTIRYLRSIGHWLFTTLLLPALFAATEVSPTREKARVVNVSSSANYLTKELDFDAIEDGPKRRSYNIWELYNKSKFVSVLHMDFTILLLTGWPGIAVCRVMSLWQKNWRVGMATKSCRRRSIQETFARIFNVTCPRSNKRSLYDFLFPFAGC